MSLFVRAGELTGRPVVTLDAAEDIAEVKDVVFSHEDAVLVGFTLNRRGLLGSPMRAVLPWSRVRALGSDAVMVASRDALGRADEDMSAVDAAEPAVIGTRVVTDGGKELGEVSDVILDVGADAAVVGYEIRGRRTSGGRGTAVLLPIADTVAVSGDALIVPATAEQYVAEDLESFGGVLDRLRRGPGEPR